MDIYLFGDQTTPVEEGLLNLLLVNGNGPLSDFLNAAFLAIQSETYSLTATETAEMPRAESLGLLLDAVRKGRRHVALDSAFLCIYEIGQYLK